MIDRREYKRETLMQVVNYTPSPYSSTAVQRGWIKDWNQSGMCLMTLQPFEQGQDVMVNHIVVPSSKRAVVRWQEKVGSAAYKAGLEFKR